LFSYTLELIPHETFINILKLFINTIKCQPLDLLKINLFNSAIIHSIPQDKRGDIVAKAKFLFLFLILGNIFKRSLFIFKTLILLPFKLGVYGFISYLFGFRPDYFLSFFDIFKFNLPS